MPCDAFLTPVAGEGEYTRQTPKVARRSSVPVGMEETAGIYSLLPPVLSFLTAEQLFKSTSS